MLLELVVASGGVTYMVRKRRRTARLIDRLVPERVPDWSSLKQQSEVMSEEEREARRYFLQTSVMLVGGVIVSLIYPPLLYALIPGIVWGVYPIFRDAYRDLTQEKKFTVIALDAVLTLLTVVYGAINPQVLLITTFSNWLYALMLKVIASSKSNTQDLLGELSLQPPINVWRVQDNIELEVPFEEVQLHDVLIVDEGQQIPVDGQVLEQAVWVDEYLLTGDSCIVEKCVGSDVFAGSLLHQGKLKLQVSRIGDETSLARLRQALNDTNQMTADIELRGKAMADRFALPGFALSVLAYPIGGIGSVMAVIMMSPCYNMRLLGLLTVMDYLQVAVHEGVLIKDGRVLESVDKINVLILDLTALKQMSSSVQAIQTVLQQLQVRGIQICLITTHDDEELAELAISLEAAQYFGKADRAQRLALVEQLQTTGDCVAYVGDGVQDGLPMQAAQVSISLNGMSTLVHDKAKVVMLNADCQHLIRLFELAERFEASMSRSLLTATVPNAISVTGSFAGVIGYMGSVGMFYSGLGLGLINVFWPKVQRELAALTQNDFTAKQSSTELNKGMSTCYPLQ